jgi:hypothetical protein
LEEASDKKVQRPIFEIFLTKKIWQQIGEKMTKIGRTFGVFDSKNC